MANIAGLIKALRDKTSSEFKQHEDWYNNKMPAMLDEYSYGDNGQPAIGNFREVGSPRDTAAEFAGAADWGQRAPADYYGALNNAKLYQNIFNNGKNAQDNITQDAAGLALGMCNPLMGKQDIVRQSVNYANKNNFGRPASFRENQ